MKCLLYFLQNILFSFLSVQCDAVYNVKSENVLQLLGDNVKISQLKQSIDVSPDYLKWSENQQKYFTSMKNNGVPRSAVYKSQASTTPSDQAFITSQNSLPINNKRTFKQAAVVQINNTTTNDQKTTTGFNNAESNEINTTASTVVYSGPVSVILGLLTVIVSFITIFGNILVLTSFFVERALRTASNYFLASLAVTDVLIGLFSMNFYTLYLILGRWPLGRLSCDLWLSLDYTACLTSQYTVLIITIDRFCSVHMPAKYRNWRTDRKVLILVAITWIIPSSVFFTTIMGWPYFNTSVSPRRSDECYAEFSNDPVFNTIFTVCYFWITLCVMLGLYVGIYRVAADLQRRSDEKRNRVSGLITTNTQNGKSNKQMKINSQINPLQNANQKGTNIHTYPNSSSLGCPGDSSGFDSDEGKLNPVKSNVLSKTNKTAEKRKVYSQSKRHNVTQPITESQIQHSISPFQKIEARCDVLPGVLENVRIIPPKPKVNDSSKPMSDNFNDSAEGDIGYILPASVMLNEGVGLMISSPVLTDDDSGLEVNYYHPVMSKLKKESSTSEFFDFLNEDETDAKTKKQDQISGQKKESKRGENNQSGTDQEYQNRVMEQFKQRLAALNNQTMKNRAPNCIKSNDQPTNVSLSKSKLTTNHSRLTLNTSNFSESTSSKGTENTTNNLCNNNNNENRTVNCVTNQKTQFSSSNIEGSNSTDADGNLQSPLFANNSSPIWKSRPVCCDGIASAPCSIKSYQCFNRRKQSDECISQQICVICMSQQQQQQQDSDTLQSSSSYGDFTSPVVCDEKCLCHSQTYTHNDNSAKVSIGTRLLYYLKTLKFKSPSVNIIEQVKKSLIRRKSKQVIERGRRENRARKALRTITFIMGAFVICWTPYHILIMIKGICDDIQQKYTCVNEIFYSVTYWLCYMNSPINPFCYALANAQFKKTFLRIFHGDFRRL